MDVKTPALSSRQSPGGFFYFWNLLVPLTVLVNIHHNGLRVHEAGLLLLLGIGPHVFEWLVKNSFFAWSALIFLFIWIDRMLRRWPCYQIYSCGFAQSLFFVVFLLAIPSLVARWMWYPTYQHLPKAFSYSQEEVTEESAQSISDAVLLVVSVVMLLHSLHLYRKD